MSRIIQVRLGHKTRPLRDGGGKPSLGRRHPAQRKHHLGALGIALANLARNNMKDPDTARTTTEHADGLATDLGYKPDIMTAAHQEIAHHTEPHSGQVADSQPFRRGSLMTLAVHCADPDFLFPLRCREGLPLGMEEPLPDT